jgi:hypothetical protein
MRKHRKTAHGRPAAGAGAGRLTWPAIRQPGLLLIKATKSYRRAAAHTRLFAAEAGIMEAKLIRTLGHTVAFLHMAAIELRHIAERAPAMRDEIGHVARQIELEAEELTLQLPEGGRLPSRGF